MKQLTFDQQMDAWRRLAPRMSNAQLRELARFDRDFDAMFVNTFGRVPRAPSEVYAAEEALGARQAVPNERRRHGED